MTGDITDEIVIKKKRRRTAVDPCLGYYKRDDGDAEPAGHGEGNIGQEFQENLQKDAQQKTVSSDSVQTFTSPFSEDAAIVTVEDFLRQQAMPNARRYRTTYSRRRQRRIQFSSSDEAENHTVYSHVPGNSSTLSPSLHPTTPRKAAHSNASKLNRPARKRRLKTGMAFSKRIQRAAMLSCVDQDTLAITPIPLHLAPHDSRISPIRPVHDKRVKIVDPRIPRQLDTSFANKENIPHKTKSCRPFLHWGSCLPPPTGRSPPIPSKDSTTKAFVHKTPHSTMITPLKLVSYKEHDEARSARFDQKLSKKGRRVITPLVFRSDCTALSTSCMSHVEDDLFMSLPTSNKPNPINPSQVENCSTLRNEDIDVGATVSFSSDSPGILVPNTPLDAPQSPLYAITDPPAGNNSSALQDLQVTYASGSSDIPFDPALNRNGSHPFPPPGMSQKPMRSLGSMLDTFMETARSVLLSQTQTQARLPSGGDNFSNVLEGTVKRTSSRRTAVSSPTRCATSKKSRASTSVMQTRSQSTMRVRKSISMPSVSAFLEDDGGGGGPTTGGLLTPMRFSSARRSPSRISPQIHSSVFHTGKMPSMDVEAGCGSGFHVAPGHSSLFDRSDGCESPNLFELLDDAEPRNNAQIILSPTV